MNSSPLLIELNPQETKPKLLAIGKTITCSDCDGFAKVIAYSLHFPPHFVKCSLCDGKGKRLLVSGPRDDDQEHYDKLSAEHKVNKGRWPSPKEREVLRDRVRESRPTRFEITRIGARS